MSSSSRPAPTKQSAALGAREALPTLGSPGRIASAASPELGAAHATLLPEVDRPVSLLQVELSERRLVISHGERPNSVVLARAVLEVFERGGAPGVAALDGNFGALIVERDSRRVWASGTLLGHRARYHGGTARAFAVSPHDLALVATGLVPPEVDRISLASMLACDWSLSGRSLLAGARRCHPLELLHFEAGRAESRALSVGLFEARLDVRDRPGVERQVALVRRAAVSQRHAR